jgi:hypothetical protein
MENQKYTMGDIEKFLIDYKECNKYNSKDWLISIPIIGTKFYRKVILENMKITFFEKMYNFSRNTLTGEVSCGIMDPSRKKEVFPCLLQQT